MVLIICRMPLLWVSSSNRNVENIEVVLRHWKDHFYGVYSTRRSTAIPFSLWERGENWFSSPKIREWDRGRTVSKIHAYIQDAECMLGY